MQDVIAETDRFTLRLWERAQAPRLLDILGRYEVAKWLGDGEPVLMRDVAEAEARIARYVERSLVSPLGTWAIVPHATGVPAGTVLLVELPDGAGEVEVGWHLHPDSHGHGYATEAARIVMDRGFANGLPDIYAVTDLDNAPSQAVCRRLGMDDLGVFTRWYRTPGRWFRATRPAPEQRAPASRTADPRPGAP